MHLHDKRKKEEECTFMIKGKRRGVYLHDKRKKGRRVYLHDKRKKEEECTFMRKGKRKRSAPP